MAITYKKLDEAVKECNRFIKKARKAKTRLLNDKFAEYGCKETSAVRRASMDLTRALAELRK